MPEMTKEMIKLAMVNQADKLSSIRESVLDPIHKTRCFEIFSPDDTMKTEVKNQILDILNRWCEENEISYTGVYMIGSSSGFQYTDYSDIDVQVDVKCKDEAQFRMITRMLPNGNLLKGTAHPINFYLIDIDREKYNEANAENIYDIINGTWKKKSDKSNLVIPFTYVNSLSRVFTDSIDHSLSQFEKYKSEYEQYKSMKLSEYDISENEWNKTIEIFENKVRECYDMLRIQLQLLRGFQHDAFNNNNAFKVSINYMSEDPRFSMNNLIYKTLDRLGYQERMMKAISEGKELIANIDPEKMRQNESIEAEEYAYLASINEDAFETYMEDAILEAYEYDSGNMDSEDDEEDKLKRNLFTGKINKSFLGTTECIFSGVPKFLIEKILAAEPKIKNIVESEIKDVRKDYDCEDDIAADDVFEAPGYVFVRGKLSKNMYTISAVYNQKVSGGKYSPNVIDGSTVVINVILDRRFNCSDVSHTVSKSSHKFFEDSKFKN